MSINWLAVRKQRVLLCHLRDDTQNTARRRKAANERLFEQPTQTALARRGTFLRKFIIPMHFIKYVIRMNESSQRFCALKQERYSRFMSWRR
ncbi:hypothetical protein VI01_20630 [Pantoea sp. SM3]|nr:hypothetical protein VI01_20630 [Pantoea sp. SM3]